MSLLKSKNIQDYIEIAFGDLIAEKEITFNIHLYFVHNNHIIVWRGDGEKLTRVFLDRYSQRGIEHIWIHKDDSEAFKLYLKPPAVPITERPPESVFITEVMQSAAIPEPQKKAIVAEAAIELFQEAVTAKSPHEQQKANEASKEIIQDVIAELNAGKQSVAEEILKMANLDLELEHSVNVSTYSVIFAMAFGKIDEGLLADISLAGLLHDLGISQISHDITSTPWNTHSPAQHKNYTTHVDQTMRLIEKFAPGVPQRTKDILTQHHEKFDGTGYPKKLEGFAFDDIAQLIALADLMDSVCSGQWDGKKRTIAETFVVLEKFEKSKTFPQYFNPDIFSLVMTWIKSSEAHARTGEARSVVESQVKKIVQKAA